MEDVGGVIDYVLYFFNFVFCIINEVGNDVLVFVENDGIVMCILRG